LPYPRFSNRFPCEEGRASPTPTAIFIRGGGPKVHVVWHGRRARRRRATVCREDWRLLIRDRAKRQLRSLMSLLKPSSPLRIAANQGSQAGVRGSRRVTINLRGQSVDSTMVGSQLAQPKKPRHDELKRTYRTYGPRLQRALDHLFGFCRATETRRRRSVDSKRVVIRVAVDRGRALAQSKGLATRASAEP